MPYYSTKTYGHNIGLSAVFRQPHADHSHCKYLHGYSLAFKFTFGCSDLDNKNWAVDFGGLKPLKQWLEDSFDHKFMAIAFRLKKKFWKLIPSMTHIDGTSRPQFVDKKDNKDFYKLLKAIKKRKKFGVVLNTSFNLHGRAMVRTPQDAIDDFLDCNIDKLYLGGFLVIKKT